MLHELVLAAQSQPDAAGFILRGIKGIFVAIGSIIAAIVLLGDRVAPYRGSGFTEGPVDVSVSSNTRGKQRQQCSQNPQELPGG
jgi:hypothetical protein